MTLPGSWNQHFAAKRGVSRTKEQFGAATYLLRVSGASLSSLSIMTGRFQSAAQLWALNLDGSVLLGPLENGRPELTKAASRPSHYSVRKFAALHGTAQSEFLILLQVANHHHYEAAIWEAPTLGAQTTIEVTVNRTVNLSALMLGILFILAIYHILIFYSRRDDKVSLWFALALLLVRCARGQRPA